MKKHPRHKMFRAHERFLGELFRGLRMKQGMTTKKLAAEACVTEHKIKQAEAGQMARVGFGELFVMSEALRFSFSLVLYEADRRLEEVGLPFLEGEKLESVSEACASLCKSGLLTLKEARRQCRILRQLPTRHPALRRLRADRAMKTATARKTTRSR